MGGVSERDSREGGEGNGEEWNGITVTASAPHSFRLGINLCAVDDLSSRPVRSLIVRGRVRTYFVISIKEYINVKQIKIKMMVAKEGERAEGTVKN